MLNNTPEKLQDKLYKRGRAMIVSIAIYRLFAALVAIFAENGFAIMLANVVIALLLVLGIRWVRYLVAVLDAISVLICLYGLLGGVLDFSDTAQAWVPIVVNAVFILSIVFYIYSVYALVFSKSVAEFYYVKRNG